MDKSAWRERLRARRRALSESERNTAAQDCANYLRNSTAWRSSEHIAVYLPNDGEMPTEAVVKAARDENKSLYLPVVCKNTLRFAPWSAGDTLPRNRFGIGEPRTPPVDLSRLQLVLLPLVGWTRAGRRLGMGGGFYDRVFAGSVAQSTLRIGVAYECQCEDRFGEAGLWDPLWDSWDVPLHALVSEAGVYSFG